MDTGPESQGDGRAGDNNVRVSIFFGCEYAIGLHKITLEMSIEREDAQGLELLARLHVEAQKEERGISHLAKPHSK